MIFKIRIAVFMLFAINSMKAQDRSYIKFEPPFRKDTLEIRDTDTLKYDLNIWYTDNSISLKSITGKLQLYNRYNLLYYGSGFSAYSGSGKMLTLSHGDRDALDNWDIKVLGDRNIPNFLNFEYRTSPTDKYDATFSLENLKNYINDLQFKKMQFHIGDKVFFFKKDGQSVPHDLHNKYLTVFFRKDGMQDINVFNNKDEFICKISYKFLVELK
jgi:hypothetical protein